MARSMGQIIFGLKLKTTPHKNALTFDFGGKKYALPFEVRTVSSNDYIFVHVPPAAQIMKISGAKLEPINTVDGAEKANASFKYDRKMARRQKRNEAMPADVKDALKKIPTGFKLGYDENGNLKLVKVRGKHKSPRKPKTAGQKKAVKRTAKKR